jgi:hypothetical protein
MKAEVRKWKKEKKRRDELLKSKHLGRNIRHEISKEERGLGKNNLLIMLLIALLGLGFILYRMQWA